ncbi:MAG: adenosylcobinamide-GDP ribazoletransferase [Nitrospirae bacterium]|nr:MAG: adenosylcobinamide-GDP ribazoletransferase [Nitrospirota bacterium]
MKSLLLAIQFLTIIPVRVKGDLSEKDIAGSARFFPVAGAVQGFCIAAAAFLLKDFFGAEITAGFVLLALLLTNGGFDMDGLMDTFDALAVKSSGDRSKDVEKRLTVMRDSAVGATGAMAMAIVLLLKFLLISRLLNFAPFPSAITLLFLMPVFSKWVTVPAMYHAKSARKDGLGRIFIENTNAPAALFSTAVFFMIAVIAGHFGFSMLGAENYALFFASSVFVLYLFCLGSVRFFDNRFGGLTGDHCGAISEISELIFMTLGYAWLRPCI